ncbi:hypothetical protein LJB92_04495 [Bacteroidales bacterium OttesenSCG-928-M06]|nr:hypothetical protein [Bacteroidales bacterium OttesenSCG-928-M06]
MVKLLLYYLIAFSVTTSCTTLKYEHSKKKPNPLKVSFEIINETKGSIFYAGKAANINIYIENLSDSIIEIADKVHFFLIHDYGESVYIAGEESGRIHTYFNSDSDENEKIILKSKEIFTYTFPLEIKKDFFYIGSNTLKILLHFRDFNSIESQSNNIIVLY